MTQFICILVLVLMSNYVAYVLGRERGLWRGYFEGRAEAYREKDDQKARPNKRGMYKCANVRMCKCANGRLCTLSN